MSRRRLVGRRPKPMVGMYKGYDGGSAITTWETTNAIGVPLGHEFGDQTQFSFFNTGTNFTNWNTWVGAKAGRRFSYSAPLLTVNDDSGLTIAQKYAKLAASSSNYDSNFTSLGNAFQAKANLQNSIVRLGWEFNGNSRAWAVPPSDATTLANYKTGFNRAAAALKAACPTLLIEWCPNCQLDYTNQSFDNMYPGDTYIDIVGIGLYDYYWRGGSPSHTTVWTWLRDGETGVNGLKHQVQLARSHNKLLGHTEWGLWAVVTGGGTTGEGDSPSFINDLYDWYETHGYLYNVYNNDFGVVDHQLDSYPNAKARYIQKFKVT